MTYREEVLDNNVADKSAPKKEAKQQVLTTETDWLLVLSNYHDETQVTTRTDWDCLLASLLHLISSSAK